MQKLKEKNLKIEVNYPENQVSFVEKKDILFLTISLFLLSLFAFLLYSDLYKTQYAQNESVGVVIFKKRNALRKIKEANQWEILKNEIPVYNGDSIKTEQLSEAVIRLKDGTEIALNENSFIIVNFVGSEAKINFNYGNIEANATEKSKVKITTQDSEIHLSSANIKIENQNQNLSLQVQKGNVDLKKGEIVQEVSENEVLQIDRTNNKIKKETIPVRLLEPENNKQFISKDKFYNVRFNFQIDPDQKYNLIIARNPNFKNPHKILPAQNNIIIPLEAGTYYWKVFSEKDVTNFYNKFTILKAEKPQLFIPENKKIFSSKESFYINFAWSKLEFATSYEVLIDKTPNFSNPIKISTISNNIYHSFEDFQNETRYYWKVIPKTNIEGLYSESEIYEFVLKKLAKEKPANLIFPLNEDFLEQMLEKGISFSWSSENPMNQIIEIARDMDFKNIIFRTELNQNYFNLKEKLPSGNYYWRVINTDGESSRTGLFHILDKMEVTLTAPLNNEVLILKPEDFINLKWKTNGKSFTQYEILISSDSDFKKILYRNFIKNNEMNLKIIDMLKKPDEGNYFWKIALYYKDKKVDEKSSQFLIYFVPEKPVILEPPPDSKFDLLKLNSINFRWKPVLGVNYYEIQIQKNNKTLFKGTTKDSYFLFVNLNLLQDGLHNFSIQSVKQIQNQIIKSEVSNINFFVSYEIQNIPEFLTPDKILIE